MSGGRVAANLLVLALVCLACQDSSRVASMRGSSRDMYPDQESWDSRVILSRNGNMVALTDSRRMVKYDERNTAQLIGNVRVDFYNEQGHHISRLYADSADVDIRANNMSAFGHVTVQSDSGHILQTSSLRWNDEYDMIATEDSVMFTTTDKDTLFGVGFESDVDLTHWKIYRPWGVTGRAFDVSD